MVGIVVVVVAVAVAELEVGCCSMIVCQTREHREFDAMGVGAMVMVLVGVRRDGGQWGFYWNVCVDL